MTITTEERAALREYLLTAKAIGWDTSHKIYVVMEDDQVKLLRDYGYQAIFTSDEMTPKQMSATITKWFAESSERRSIEALGTPEIGPSWISPPKA
jgi:hypothetical protein